MESVKTNEGELTSTMGNLLSTNKDDKNDASDSTPTSSTDAFTTTSTSHITADDPISSTSSDVMDAKKSTEKVNDVAQSSTNVISSNPPMSCLKNISIGDHSSPIVSEKDLLDMNITDTSTEKITENVDDIVQDLENLLGEPTTSFNFTIKSKETRNLPSISHSKDINVDIDAFSAELQMLEEQSNLHNTPVHQEKPVPPKTETLSHPSTVEIIPTENAENTMKTDTKESSLPEQIQSSEPDNKHIAHSENVTDIKPSTIEKLTNEGMDNCQFEIISESSATTETAVPAVEKNEFSETHDITSTLPKSEDAGKAVDSNVEDVTDNVTISKEEHDVEGQVALTGNKTAKCEDVLVCKQTEMEVISSNKNLIDVEMKEVTEKDSGIQENLEESGVQKIEEKPEEKLSPKSECTSNEVDVAEEQKQEDTMDVDEHPQNMTDMPVSNEVNKNISGEEKVETSELTKAEKSDLLPHNEAEPQTSESFEMLNKAVEFESDTTEVKEIEPSTTAELPKTNQEESSSVQLEVPKEDTVRELTEAVETDSSKAEFKEPGETNKLSTNNVELTKTIESESSELAKTETQELEATTSSELTKTIESESSSTTAESENLQQMETDLQSDVSIANKKSDISESSEQDPECSMSKSSEKGVPVELADNAVDDLPAELPIPHQEINEIVSNNRTEEAISTIEMMDVEKPSETEEPKPEDVCKSEKLEVTTSDMASEDAKLEQQADDTLAEVVTEITGIDNQAVSSSSVEETNISQSTDDVPPNYPVEIPSMSNMGNLAQSIFETEPEELKQSEELIKNEVVTGDTMEIDGDLEKQIQPVVECNDPVALDESISNVGKFNEDTEGVEIPQMDTPKADDNTGVDFIPENVEIASHSLAADLDLLVQNAVSDDSMSSTLPTIDPPTLEEKVSEDLPIPVTSSIDDLKTLEQGVIENNILPLAMEDVPDIEVLNAISTLSDNKSSLIAESTENIQESDALLTSSSLEQPAVSDVSFETNLDSALPTVEEIFGEQSQEQSVELQDDNLETLLAVASLQSVDYNLAPVEDLAPPEEASNYVPEETGSPIEEFSFVEETAKIPEEKIEPPLPQKELLREVPVQASENVASSKIHEAPEKLQENKLQEPLLINIDDSDKERVYSPKITIKPIKPPEEEVEAGLSTSSESESKGSLKMTITKQGDNTHSILKIYDPDNDNVQSQEDQTQTEPTVPKLIIKPVVNPNEQPQSPKMSTRSSKVFSPSSSTNQRSASPRITIKPIPKPEEPVAPLKITIKPVLKPEESHKQKHSPKLTIKPIVKPEEESMSEPKVHSPRVTIKPIVKPPEEMEQVSSPRITIKPIVKPAETSSEPVSSTPRVTIKPVVKPPEKNSEVVEQVEKSSPKITIKPIVKPQEVDPAPEDVEESIKERIVLKINKGTIPGSSKELRKREVPVEEEKSEKLAKIKLKFSKEGGHPQIVQDQSPTKRAAEQIEHDKNKRPRMDAEFLPGVTITPIAPSTHSKLKEMLSRHEMNNEKVIALDDDDDDVTIVDDPAKSSPIIISEESNQDSVNTNIDMRDPISEIPVFEITPDSVKTINPQPVAVEVPAPLPPAPRKRGRPRKVPLQVREDFKDPKEEEPKPVVVESTRPKRSCRGQSVRTTLGIKPRKPRGPGRGRGSKRGMGTRSTPTPPEVPQTSPKAAKELKLSGTKLKELKEDSFLLSDKSEVKTIEIDDGLQKSPSNSLLAPPHSDTSTTDRADIVMYEEETRMSAETSSRAQTPAKQVVTSISAVDIVEESQSSVQSIQSTATTESVKVRRGPRLEVHQEPEGAVISADQLAEYYWSGGGPYMLQEQVAQFLGIKSFKRKYPNIPRRVVDMQERDFIRESGLAGEAMCDLGLTAVNSSDILDIMYSDFQDKYEEYCKHQRDRQAKDLINKQKALSLAASQEKAKMDITQQAVQSAASWNANFNKVRRDQRKSCMDLQTLTIHFPKGKMKQINKPKIGNYPVALVPGQYTDYYRDFTPTELNNLPLNTLCYDRILRGGQEMDCDSQTDGSGSESDSSSSDSDSSYSGSSDGEDCTLCKPTPKRVAAAQ